MKIGRIISVVLAIAIIASGSTLGYMYYTTSKQHKTEVSNISNATIQLASLQKAKANLDSQLAKAVSDVASWNDKIVLLQTMLKSANTAVAQSKTNFPASVQTIEYTETLTSLAKSSNITLQLLVAIKPVQADLSTPDFIFYSSVFSLKISGKMSDMLDYLNKIVVDPSFQTGAVSPVNFAVPAPLSQSVKDQMRADIKARMVADKTASLSAEGRVSLVEQALLEPVRNGATGVDPNTQPPSVTQMTKMITDLITAQISPEASDLCSAAIVQAIEEGLANTVIDTVAGVYANAISAAFTLDFSASLLPIFRGPLGDEITAAIQHLPQDAIAATVAPIISKALNSLVNTKIAALVSNDDIDTALLAAVKAAEMPSAQLTIGVYSYKGS